MSRVIVRNASYRYEQLKPLIFEIMDSFVSGSIKKGQRVVVKPNLLGPAPPESAMLTHPMVVKAVVEYCNDKGVIPQVSDSNAMGTFEKVLETSGIKAALRGLKVNCKEFKSSGTVEVGEPFKRLEIAVDALEADVLINLPKLKTHSQMLLTLGVKNLYGCIVGMRKPEWHFRTGENRGIFARLLVQNYQAIAPSLTILDGILAMEGQGPGRSGTPRELGVIFGSEDAVALDVAVCRMLGLEWSRLLTNKAASEMGLTDGTIELDGELPSVKDYCFPEISPLVFGPKPLHGLMRRHVVQRPVVNTLVCRACGECSRYCPAGAISLEGKKLSFDYDACIRCYCCIEVCPFAALTAHETMAGKVLKKFINKGD